ncbi:MAG: helix-turn-helix transcriptional regulator [Clostridia bacterium]|nr:helix-turn-helix transcriptional regulator [Clostridia bacterium]
MGFGINLKKIRQDNDLTQEELAKKISTSRSNIANYENDKNMPSVDMLEKISKELHCSIDYLMGKSYYRNKKDYQAATKHTVKFLESCDEVLKKIINISLNGLISSNPKNIDDINDEIYHMITSYGVPDKYTIEVANALKNLYENYRESRTS